MRKSAAIWLSIAAILCLVSFSPFYLQWLAAFKKADWAEIGNIGQAYGAASAILSALALLGVAISARLQMREHFANRSQIVNAQHFRLLELALENPEQYLPIFWPDREGTVDEMRQHLYTTMLVNYLHTGYSLGQISESSLREEAFSQIFATEPGQKWWMNGGEQAWMSDPSCSRKFLEILADEYAKAVSQQRIPIRSVSKAEDRLQLKASSESRSHAAKIAVAGLAGALIGAAVVGVKRKRW